MNLKEYEQLIEAAVSSGNTEFLAKECVERMRVNTGLIAESAELQRKMTAARRGCVYTELDGNICGNFVEIPLCDEHLSHELRRASR